MRSNTANAYCGLCPTVPILGQPPTDKKDKREILFQSKIAGNPLAECYICKLYLRIKPQIRISLHFLSLTLSMPSKTHINYIDSLRGLAALTVFNEHYILAYGLPCETASCRQIMDSSPLNFWWDGGAAVAMFFILSGFVLSLRYFHSGHQPDLSRFSLIGFLLGRIFRIWMPYLVVLCVSAVFYLQYQPNPIPQTLLHPTDWLVSMWHAHSLTLMDMFRESWLLKLPNNVILLPQAWTLTIELSLSLLLPIGLLLIERGLAWLAGFSLFAVLFLGVCSYLLHFLLGLLIARYLTQITAYLSMRHPLRLLVLLGGFILYSSGNWFISYFPENSTHLFLGLGAGLLLISALASKTLQTILSYNLLRQIGKISYSAYLIHMLILICVTPYILQSLEAMIHSRILLWLAGFLVSLTIVQLVSLPAYHFLEIPSISLGRKAAGFIKRKLEY